MAKQKPVRSGNSTAPKRTATTSVSGNASVPLASSSHWMVGAIAAILGFCLYINTFGHQWCLDDYSAIKENWIVQSGFNWESLKLIFTTEYRYGAWNSPGSLYRPMTLAVFALEWDISPDDPKIGHVMNAIWYGITGLVLWLTWSRILRNYPPVLTAITVLLFIAHPIHTEVVANTKSRDEIFSLLFCTLALYYIWKHLDSNKLTYIIAALLSFAVAMFSKEGSITYILIFPLAVWFFRDETMEKTLKIGAIMATPAIFFMIVRHFVLAGQEYKEEFSELDNFIVATDNVLMQKASAFMMCLRYFQTLVIPHPLISDMGFPQYKPVSFADPRALVGLLLMGGMFVWALLNLKHKKVLAFAIMYFLITFSVASNIIVTIGTSYGERLLYVPSVAFSLAFAYALCKLFKINDMESVWNPNGKGVVWAIALVFLALYSFKTIQRNPDWRVSGDLYTADLPYSPNCAKLNYHNGIEVIKKGMIEETSQITDTAWVYEAIKSHTKAIELFPRYHDAYGSRGLAYFRLGQNDKAFEDYQTSIKYRPNNATVLSNLGFIHFMRGNLQEAEKVYRESIKYDPRFVDARRNLGAVMAMKKQFPQAIEQWLEGLKYKEEDYTLLFYIGSAYKDMGQMDKAQPWLDRAERAKIKEATKKKTSTVPK
jgi:protein O-mannosyl-transferase